jgi:hypothetical protein
MYIFVNVIYVFHLVPLINPNQSMSGMLWHLQGLYTTTISYAIVTITERGLLTLLTFPDIVLNTM